MAAFGSFTAGQVLTAAELNGAWVAFTPTWTNVTLGSGATQGWAYCYSPGGMWISGQTVLGTGGSVSGTVTMTLPNSETSKAGEPGFTIGTTVYIDANGGDSTGVAFVTASDTTIELRTATFTPVSTSTPFTWAVGDFIRMTIFVPL